MSMMQYAPVERQPWTRSSYFAMFASMIGPPSTSFTLKYPRFPVSFRSFVDPSKHNSNAQVLPPYRQPERVVPVIVHKVLHLAEAVVPIILGERRPSSAGRASTVGVAAKVEAGDVDPGKLELPGGGGRRDR
jgi:hypothetical protein